MQDKIKLLQDIMFDIEHDPYFQELDIEGKILFRNARRDILSLLYR